MELRFLENDNDYLVYGFNEDFVYSHPDLDRIECLEDFRPIADENNLIVFQAHPFRVGMTVTDDKLLDELRYTTPIPVTNRTTRLPKRGRKNTATCA